jgi:hypothetical protein
VRTAWSAVATLVALLVAAVPASVVAVDARNRAERAARVAMARLLGIESGSVGADNRDVGLLLAAQEYTAAPDTSSSWGRSSERSPRTARWSVTFPTRRRHDRHRGHQGGPAGRRRRARHGDPVARGRSGTGAGRPRPSIAPARPHEKLDDPQRVVVIP